MTDQPQPDNKSKSESTTSPAPDVPLQEKNDAVSGEQATAPKPAINDDGNEAKPTVSSETLKPTETSSVKQTTPATESPSQPTTSSASDPTQPSKERMSTIDLNDPRFKDIVNPSQGPKSISDSEQKTEVAPSNEQSRSESEPKVTQRLPDPSGSSASATSNSASASSAAIICPTCGHRNRPGVLLCENCGTNLMTGGRTSIGTRDLKKDEAKPESTENLLDTSERKAVETAGGMIFTEDMVLRIEIEGGTTPMLVYPKQEIIMGRRDPNTGGMPDVDLTAYAGYRMGVSRRHAAIRLQEQHLHVSDLGSSNGTFLNGTRLNAHRPYQLRDGDEVRLGQMVLRLFYQTNKDRK